MNARSVARVISHHLDGRRVIAETTDWELSGVLARAELERLGVVEPEPEAVPS